MKLWPRCFGRLFQADLPQERVLGYLIIGLAIAYVGLTWLDQSSACASAENHGQGIHSPIQALSCD